MYYLTFHDEDNKTFCGSDWSMFIRLKTVRGALKRARDFIGYNNPNVKTINVYSCSEETKYRDNLPLITTITL